MDYILENLKSDDKIFLLMSLNMFFGRKEEIKELNKELNIGGRLVVLTGRRRVGKNRNSKRISKEKQ